ncbi:hypothetical protein JTB14_036616 [Gonioctena quinquepunctata]|nr:hypothetical protein JTB14_036616 [Gonioctena quinquepunctata]
MLQEDSNGESSFEIIEKKNRDGSEKTGSLSNLSTVSSPYSIPSPSGNLLSNVAPPTSLPDFTIWPNTASVSPVKTAVVGSIPQTVPIQQPPLPTVPATMSSLPSVRGGEQFPTTQFSAAIPPSKGVQFGPVTQQKYTEKDNSGGFMGLVKEAFSSGGVLSKMAEKARSSVDSIITTLDPQMSEFINSGGDTEVTVISENEEEVTAVREAFHSVLGKSWVNGVKLNVPPKKSQAVGYEAAKKNAEEKIEYSLKYRNTPSVAIENFLMEQNEEWFDLTLLILKDNERQITVQTLSQATPVPVDEFLRNIASDTPDYKTLSTQEKLALTAQAKGNWQQHISGVSRKEVILLAGKTLVSLYKSKLPSKN